MKQQIRVGVFETNSSSEHSISISNEMVILSEEEYEEYESGSLKITPKGEKITKEEFRKEMERIENKCTEEWNANGGVRNYKSLEDYIQWVKNIYYWSHDIKEYGAGAEAEIFHASRDINGETVHVISICEGEDYEYFNG